jgi:hypothetical protein
MLKWREHRNGVNDGTGGIALAGLHRRDCTGGIALAGLSVYL